MYAYNTQNPLLGVLRTPPPSRRCFPSMSTTSKLVIMVFFFLYIDQTINLGMQVGKV